MNKAIYKMELIRNLKSFIIWTSSICGILFLGMLFYPAINTNGLLSQMEALFENPMMKGMLALFGADVSSLGSLTGFYVTYNSIYNVLLGCIFASILAGNLLAREEADKTAEFLFTKPVSRGAIYLSKGAVLFTYLTLFSILYFLVSLAAMETVKRESPDQLFLTRGDKNILVESIKAYPGEIYEAFNLTDESLARISLSYASDLLASSTGEVRDMNLNGEDLNRMLEEAAKGPEVFFENVLKTPETYMPLFSIPIDQKEDFLNNVKAEQKEYRAMKKDFYRSPDLFLMFFESDPSFALDPFLGKSGSMDNAIRLLKLPNDMEARIFRKYSPRIMVILCTYIWLLICSVGFLVLFISLLVKRGQSILGASLGMVFFFYFINSLSTAASALSPLVKVLGYISPFTWMDRDFTNSQFALLWWRVLLFVFLSGSSLFGGYRVFRKKDILL
jgi:hypothetical protein